MIRHLIAEDSEWSKKRNRVLLPSDAGIKGFNTSPLCGASLQSASRRIGVQSFRALGLIPFISQPYVICFDATIDCLWAAVVTVNGQIIINKTMVIKSGLERSRKMIRLISSILFITNYMPVGVATVIGPATPGGVRLGVTLANALAFACGVSVRSCVRVNNQLVKLGPKLKPGYLRPQYSHPPHITK